MSNDSEQSASAAAFDGFIFRKSLPLQIELQEILAALGEAGDLSCLEIGGSNTMFSYQLRRAGGRWHTLTTEAEAAARLREGLETEVDVLSPGDDRFPKYTFDAVVVAGGVLEAQPSEADFIRCCHRMLKPDGRLIICVARAKRFSLIRLLMCLPPAGAGAVYTESRLFGVLKNGFDVSSMRTYMRFFTTAVDTVMQAAVRRRPDRPLQDRERLYTIAGVCYWIAFQMDALLLLTRGHRMIAVAGRRGWRSRDAPVLSDGRSISEAVLKPIG